MPTTPGTSSTPLNPQQAVEKFTSLISESPSQAEAVDEEPETSPAPTPSEPPSQSSETEPPAEPPDERYEVKVDGEPVQVDLEELKAGYSRDADYRRKTMALAEDRRSFEAESQAVQQERQRYQEGLQQLTQALQQLQGEPDWDTLHKELPADEFLKQKADWEHHKLNVQRLKDEQDRVAQQAQREQAAQYQKYLRAEEDKLKAAVPEWYQDLDTGKAELAKLKAHVKSYGVSDAQVEQAFTSAAAILLARDAFKYRELHREPTPAAKAKGSPIKAAKPGTPERPRPNEKQRQLIERAATSHRAMDAMKAIEAMLPD